MQKKKELSEKSKGSVVYVPILEAHCKVLDVNMETRKVTIQRLQDAGKDLEYEANFEDVSRHSNNQRRKR